MPCGIGPSVLPGVCSDDAKPTGRSLRESIESLGLVGHNSALMRRIATFPVCLTFLLASFVAPYQHIHVGTEGHGGSDHELVHIHFYAISVPANVRGVSAVNDNDETHISRPLDTFISILQVVLLIIALPVSQALLIAPEKSLGRAAEFIEPCGHDPPFLESCSPRPPPA